MDWQDEIRTRYPDWGTAAARVRWPAVRSGLLVGQWVSGTVIAQAPFGIWLDIGIEFPALLMVPYMRGAQLRSIAFADFPSVGSRVEGRICAVGDAGEISVTQERPEEDPWRDPSEFAVGSEFTRPVARVLDYGYLVEIKPGVVALLPPERTDRRLDVGDEIPIRVECVDPAGRKVEVSLVGMETVEFNRISGIGQIHRRR